MYPNTSRRAPMLSPVTIKSVRWPLDLSGRLLFSADMTIEVIFFAKKTKKYDHGGVWTNSSSSITVVRTYEIQRIEYIDGRESESVAP